MYIREVQTEMPSIKLSDHVYSVGVLNPIMRIFDVIMATDYGTTYNSYIVRGENKTALIETCHLTYFDRYVENIKSVCDPAEIDYIVLNHCEPDHSGALRRLLELCPNASIVVSRAGSIYLRGITNREDLPVIIAADGDEIELGGRSLRFIIAPFLHWPDSMFTYLEADKILFSCDFLGAHYCEPHTTDTNIAYPKKYKDALAYYYAAIFGPFAKYVRDGLSKIADIEFDMACTSHGPVLTRGGMLPYALAQYAEWSREPEKSCRELPVFYCSAYGNTGLLAEAIARGIRKALPDCICTTFDINEHDMGELSAMLNRSDAFAVGSPTINGDAVAPVWNLLSHVDAINNKKKPVLIFGSYGWSGEATANIAGRLQGLKMSIYGEPLRTVFVPDESDLERAEALGREFAASL